MSDNPIPDPNPTTDSTPENALGLTWSQIRSILKDGAQQTKDAMNTAMANQSELSDPLVTCPICIEPYHSQNVEGQIEKPALAACGHIFGDVCIELWLAKPMKHVAPSCPVCRFSLQFPVCKHAIGALDPYDTTNLPPPVLKNDLSDMPPSCSECSLLRQPAHYRYHHMEQQKKEYSQAITSLEATIANSKAAGVKDSVTHSEKQKKAYEAALQLVEQEISTAKAKLYQEKEKFLAYLKKKNIWHLKVDTTKWTTPGEGHDNGEVREWEGDEDDEDEYDDGYEGMSDRDDRDGGSMADVDDLVEQMVEDLSTHDIGELATGNADSLIDLDEAMNLDQDDNHS